MKDHERLHAIKEAASAIHKMKHLSAEQRAWLLNQLKK